ncbi:MAG: activator of HSP90 ATPase 1 family protein [Bacteroidia bacterium]|nr:activator of HSP90 ATPase 1 family protein [Bacteroidia bacterium]
MNRVKVEMEYLFRASPTILYKFFTTPATLVRWFCDEVDIEKDVFTFVWEGSEEKAGLIDDFEDEKLVWEWEEGEANEFWEVKFDVSPVTGETIMTITEFCDDIDEEDTRQLWDSLVKRLRQETGG